MSNTTVSASATGLPDRRLFLAGGAAASAANVAYLKETSEQPKKSGVAA